MKDFKRIGISVLLLFALTLSGCGKTDDALSEEELLELSEPSTENYAWIGDYIDDTYGEALLTIEKSTRFRKDYAITIYIPSGEAAFSLWQANAVYDADLNALYFDDCSRVDGDTSILPEANAEETTESADAADEEELFATHYAYTDGTGSIFVADDVLIWIDDQDSRGDELRFRRIEGTTATDLPAETTE